MERFKLYEALSRALQKKTTAMAARQQVENYKGLRGQEFSGIIGGDMKAPLVHW